MAKKRRARVRRSTHTRRSSLRPEQRIALAKPVRATRTLPVLSPRKIKIGAAVSVGPVGPRRKAVARASPVPRPVLVLKAPKTRSVCERRQSRRQVLHAKGVAGGRVRKGRMSATSKIICRRK